MKEKPILFKAEMVRAILDRRKRQTRRICKPQPANYADGIPEVRVSPYGPAGDRVWVKESWRAHVLLDNEKPSDIGNHNGIIYEADGKATQQKYPSDMYGKLRPSIFMCRWMSRIDLLITEVRAQKLQDISEKDAIAEGVMSHAMDPHRWYDYGTENFWLSSARASFMSLWRKINGDQSWYDNPWVLVIEFKRVGE